MTREEGRRMTLDEAIKHAEEVAEEQEKAAKEWHDNQVRKCELIRFTEMDYTHENECKKCAKEHWQLAEWLRELKAYKEQTDGDLISRQAVLDLCGTGKWLEEYRAEENGVKTRGYDTLKMINYTKLLKLPVIPQTDYENYEEFGWCKGCKEYDTEKHCCHRYSSFIRESLQDNINAVLEDIKAEMEKEQAECPYPLDIEHAITIIDKYISRKE